MNSPVGTGKRMLIVLDPLNGWERSKRPWRNMPKLTAPLTALIAFHLENLRDGYILSWWMASARASSKSSWRRWPLSQKGMIIQSIIVHALMGMMCRQGRHRVAKTKAWSTCSWLWKVKFQFPQAQEAHQLPRRRQQQKLGWCEIGALDLFVDICKEDKGACWPCQTFDLSSLTKCPIDKQLQTMGRVAGKLPLVWIVCEAFFSRCCGNGWCTGLLQHLYWRCFRVTGLLAEKGNACY